MKLYFFIFLVLVISLSFSELRAEARESHLLFTTTPVRDTIKKKNNKDEKWNIFWKEFTMAIQVKDKQRVAVLTSKDFYDGGGGTVEQWLDAEVFRDVKTFNSFKNSLKTGAKNFKGFDGHPYKATGKNRSGDLFFEFRNNQWLFGGVVGD